MYAVDPSLIGSVRSEFGAGRKNIDSVVEIQNERQTIILLLIIFTLIGGQSGNELCDESIPVRSRFVINGESGAAFLGCPISWEGCRSVAAWIARVVKALFATIGTLICPGLPANNFTPGKMSLSKTYKRVT